MKKILFIFSLLILSVAYATAQNTTLDATLQYAETYMLYTGVATDTVGSTDSVWTYTVRKKNDARMYPVFYLDIDTLTGTSDSCTIVFQNKAFTDDSFTTLATITYKGSADTIIEYEPTGPYRGEYWKVGVTANSGFKGEIQKLNEKFVK